MRQVREAFEAARIDDDAIGDAICVVETYLAAHPDHLVATAYLGSLHAMCAGAAHLPWIKLKHAAIASRLLDGAHERWRGGAHRGSGETYPGELEILLLRGVAYANFPAFLGKAQAARTCLEQAENHPAFSTIPAIHRSLAYAHMAVLCHRAGECDLARDYARYGMLIHEATATAIWAAR